MIHRVNLVQPKAKRKRLTLSEYKKLNPKGFDKLMTALIRNMVKHDYKKK
jgi:hypothetical protein